MTYFNILKRIKDSNGVVKKYEIQSIDTGKTSIIDSNTAISLHNRILNASLTKNMEYKANTGSKILTEVEMSNLLPTPQPSQLSQVRSDVAFDYYGREFIKTCRLIRKSAISGKIIIDKKPHKSNEGRNIHLFKLIDACGITVEDFVKGYLSVLQPYSLEYFQKYFKEATKEDTWIVDIGYRVKLVIKLKNLRSTQDTIVVSFHESNIKGGNSLGRRDFSDKPCAVFINKLNTIEQDYYPVDFVVQRGFLRYNIRSFTKYVNKDIALINYSDIESRYALSLGSILARLNDMYYSDNSRSIQPILDLINIKEISFMSFGYCDVNNLSYLIDIYSQVHSNSERSVIVDIATNLVDEIPYERQLEIKEGLISKYGVGNNKLCTSLIDRVT